MLIVLKSKYKSQSYDHNLEYVTECGAHAFCYPIGQVMTALNKFVDNEWRMLEQAYLIQINPHSRDG